MSLSTLKRRATSTCIAAAILSFHARALSAEERVDRPSEQPRSSDEEEHLRIGPIVGVGFPRPLAIEGLVKVERVIALGVEYSALPRTNIAGVESSIWALAGDLRVFPFKGAFFIGARVGHQTLDASTTLADSGLAVTETATASAWFVNPRIGFLWTWSSGITLGIDAGVQIPLDASFTTSLPAGVSPIDSTVATVAGALGNGVTPTIDLLRLGFLF